LGIDFLGGQKNVKGRPIEREKGEGESEKKKKECEDGLRLAIRPSTPRGEGRGEKASDFFVRKAPGQRGPPEGKKGEGNVKKSDGVKTGEKKSPKKEESLSR